MEVVVDNQIVQILVADGAEVKKNRLLVDVNHSISFRWPSLLEYLGLGTLFIDLPVFDQTEPLFQASVAALCVHNDKNELFHIYDHLFAVCLHQIKNLPQITSTFLLEAIATRQAPSDLEIKKQLSSSLNSYEEALKANPSHTIHDLILYLAWDRICVWMSRLFDYQSADSKFISGLEVLKDCLIESFQHIMNQGRTSPSIYRLLESLFFYYVREENLQKHTDDEWPILNQNFQSLSSQEELVDYFYIDDAVASSDQLIDEVKTSRSYLILDMPDKVNIRLSYANYMINKLRLEVPEWNYGLQQEKIVYF